VLDDVDCLLRVTTVTGKLQECVLLIEDSEDAMLLVRYSLLEYGDGRYRLKWVESLSEGLDLLSKGGVDIVLLDLSLRDSAGPSSFASVRETAPEVPVLVLTGDTSEETEFAAAAWGVDDYLVKDQVSGARLVEVIHTLIDARKLQKRRKAMHDRLIQRSRWKFEP
jgi:DNA-binding response OmpR family regulator